MAQFQPGNPGRPKGCKNKFKQVFVRDFFNENEIHLIKEIWEEIQYLKPVDRVKAKLMLLQWVEPRIQKIEAVDARTEEEATGLMDKVDVHLLEVLQPEKNVANS